MKNIWKLKDLKDDFIKIEYLEEGIFFKFDKINISNFDSEEFNEEIRRKLILREKYTRFTEFSKPIPNIKKENIIIIKKQDNSYLLMSTFENPIIYNNGIKILTNKKKIIQSDLELPFIFKIDEKTKKVNLRNILTKEIETLYEIAVKLLNNNSTVMEDYKEYFLGNNRQATSSANGYIKQSLIALYFIFKEKNYEQIKNIKIEGKLEDIEIEYRNESYDYIQVKISENPGQESTFNTSRFIEGINGLKLTHTKTKKLNINTKNLIYASNTIYQPLERQTNLLKNGYFPNLYETCKEDILVEENENLKTEYDLEDDFINKFAISRVDSKFLKIDANYFYPEYDQLNEILNTSDIKVMIFKELKDLCLQNSIIREKKINIYEIAYIFLQKTKSSKKFNNDFADEIEEFNEEEIEEFIINERLKEIINSESRQMYLVECFLELKEEFEEKNESLELSNLKVFIEQNHKKLKKYDLFSSISNNKKKDLLHKYLLFKIYKNEQPRKEINSCFKLEEL